MKKISKAEYLAALKIVERYHKQLYAQIEDHSSHKTSIEDWFANLPVPPSTKLKNILFHRGPFKYLEDITRYEFMISKYPTNVPSSFV